MYDYVIIHASFGSPFEHWTPWLFNALTQKNKSVLAPQFPCGLNIQTYKNWAKVLDAYKGLIGETTTFIGHSIGPAFICNYIAYNKLKVKSLFLVAPLYDKINVPDYDHVNSTFFECNELSLLPNLSQKRFCYISKTDPYVPISLSEQFAEKISGSKIYVEDAGHFNTMAGYTSFPQLLQDISTND